MSGHRYLSYYSFLFHTHTRTISRGLAANLNVTAKPRYHGSVTQLIQQTKRCLNEFCLRVLVQTLVISRLDYCNSVLVGLPDCVLKPLSSVLHSAARLIKGVGPRDHITPILRQLHWLPIRARIRFKISLLMYQIFAGLAPIYISDLVTSCSAIPAKQRLRSASKGNLETKRSSKTVGSRAFSLAGPHEWNKLPDRVRQSETISEFKSRLKTHLFAEYYD